MKRVRVCFSTACALAALIGALVPGAALAAQTDPAHHHAYARPPAPHWHGLSDLAQRQIDQVTAAVAGLQTPDAARAAGFRPALGLIPTMGVHWVSRARMRDGEAFSLERPDHLMFSPVNGEETLVGVAFAYRGEVGGATPDGFDGDFDTWHDHPELARPGETLTMLHVWFVPSPDGPFAGHNPWLPYWAAGVEPPIETDMADATQALRVRKLGLAISETVGQSNLVEISRRFGGEALDQRLTPRREAIRTLVPKLDAARRAGDVAEWNRLADAANAEWDEIRNAYLGAIPIPLARQRLADFFDEMLHGHRHGSHQGSGL